MRLLITGAGGQLGRDLNDCARVPGVAAAALTRNALDITNRQGVAAALDQHRPTVLVNCAAWTDVDGAEAHATDAYAINAAAPRLLAEECARRDVLLLHLSTDYVFAGDCDEHLDEDAPPSPLSVYGASKLAGEEGIRSVTPRHLIVRTSGLYGRDGPNFVVKVLRRAADGGQLRVVTDQITAPTWTGHLAPALLRLLSHDVTGTVHLTNSGATSWHHFATAAVADAGYHVAVNPITTADLASPARRPKHALLANNVWRTLGEAPLPSWSEGLSAYVKELRQTGRLQ